MKNNAFLLKTLLVIFTIAASFSNLNAQRDGGGRGWRNERREPSGHFDSWRYFPVRGQVFYHTPESLIRINFGGNPYFFSDGMFYKPYGRYYQIVPPPIGITINVLPYGYWPLRWGAFHYVYFNGIFYRPNNNAYEVVQAPVGAEVPAIPRDAKVVVIDGKKYYEYNGTYFKEIIKPNGEIWYMVEGKYGVLNTEKNNQVQNNTQPTTEVPVTKYKIGDVVEQLPNNCKTIVINSKKYFVSNDNVYYEEFIDGNSLKYKIVGQ